MKEEPFTFSPHAFTTEPLEKRKQAPGGGEHYWQFCANCGTKLEGRKCKLICPKCGFYHSCSEP